MTQPNRRKRYDSQLDRTLGRARRKIASTLGVLIVAFNIIAGVGLGASAKAASPMFADVLGDHIVICTAFGQVVVDHEGRRLSDQAPHTPPGHLGPQCVYCLPLMQGNLIAPSPQSAAIVRQASAAPPAASASAQPSDLFRPLTLRARGPPTA
jgi:hypothetical protein